MATLQHELQHVLDYRTGRLTGLGYLLDPREWIYGIELDTTINFDRLGAEQRAALAERLWLAENGFGADNADKLRSLIPWAQTVGSPTVGVQGAA